MCVVVALTGGTGFLGQHLLKRLTREFDSVRVLSRNPPASKPKGVEWFKGDLGRTELIGRDFFRDVDYLFHSAAKVGNWPRDPSAGYTQVNVDGTKYILQSGYNYGVEKMVYTSSYFALGPTDSTPKDETWINIPEFTHPYISTKFKAGMVVDNLVEVGHPIVQVNPTIVVGPGMDNLINDTFRDYIGGRFVALPGDGKVVWNFVHVDDVVEGHFLAFKKGRLGEKYILGGENVELITVFNRISELLNLKPIRKLPIRFAKIYAFLLEKFTNPKLTRDDVEVLKYHFAFSSQKAVQNLRYDPTSLDLIINTIVESASDLL